MRQDHRDRLRALATEISELADAELWELETQYCSDGEHLSEDTEMEFFVPTVKMLREWSSTIRNALDNTFVWDWDWGDWPYDWEKEE